MPRRIAFALVEHGRATEWITSLVLLGFAATLALPGDTLSGAGFKTFRDIGLDEAMISTPLALIATVRLVALYINGSWRRSPMMRLIGACIGSGILGMLAMAFGWPYFQSVVLSWPDSGVYATHFAAVQNIGASTGAATYMILSLFDLLAAYRSGADLRISRPEWSTT